MRHTSRPEGRDINASNALYIAFIFGYAMYFFNGIWNALFQRQTLVYYTLDFSTRVLLPVIVFVVLRLRGVQPAAIGLNVPSLAQFAKQTILCILLLAVPYLVVDHFLPGTRPILYIRPAEPESGLARLLFAIYFAVSAGVPEEFLFRGLALSTIGANGMRRAAFLVTSSFLFGITHWEGGLSLVLGASIFGLIAGLLYLRLRNLWGLIFAHSAVDFFLYYALPLLIRTAGTGA